MVPSFSRVCSSKLVVLGEWQRDILTVVRRAFTKAKECVDLGDVQDSVDGRQSSAPST